LSQQKQTQTELKEKLTAAVQHLHGTESELQTRVSPNCLKKDPSCTTLDKDIHSCNKPGLASYHVHQ